MTHLPTDRVVLARECDRYAAHLTNRNAMLDAADLFARCAIALRQPAEPGAYEWMRQNPDECASAVQDAYTQWSPGEDGFGGDFGALLDNEVSRQKLRLALTKEAKP